MPHTSNIIWYLSFYLWLPLVWSSLGPPVLLQMALLLSFSWLCNIPLSVSHLLYPLLCGWIFSLLPCLDSCAQGCSEHGCACVVLDYSFAWAYAREWGGCIVRQLYFYSFQKPRMLFSVVVGPISFLTHSVAGFLSLSAFSSCCHL